MSSEKKSALLMAQEEAQNAVSRTNHSIEILGEHSSGLNDALIAIQNVFDTIRNVPSDTLLTYNDLKKTRLTWKEQVDKIEKDYSDAVSKVEKSAVGGTLAGIGVGALGPTAAMGVATTFGVASTGTAISALSGAAASNAALAWLGGGAIAAGGGGMAAGQALLAMAGPVGWTIAGVALVASGIYFWIKKNDKNKLDNVYTLISKRDIKSYDLATVEINERISRIKNETSRLWKAVGEIGTFGTDYTKMSEGQQYTLGAYVNLMLASTQLLVNPIMGLQPKFGGEDLKHFSNSVSVYRHYIDFYPDVLIYFANLLYRIDIDKDDQKLLLGSFKNNDGLLKSLNITKDELTIDFIEAAHLALWYKYRTEA